jgi:hypothetical protein
MIETSVARAIFDRGNSFRGPALDHHIKAGSETLSVISSLHSSVSLNVERLSP